MRPWNVRSATMVATMKAASAATCAIRNGGSDCVGASALQHRNLLERLHDQHEHVEPQRDHRGDHVDPAPRAGRAGTGRAPGIATSSTTSERMPTMCDGSSLSNGKPKPVRLVKMVVQQERDGPAVQPLADPSMPNATTRPGGDRDQADDDVQRSCRSTGLKMPRIMAWLLAPWSTDAQHRCKA